ncbi:MAG: flavin reductase family protein [Elusimicrobia bacterium]|nr:flavin reductase family protein [Elusimicrobiota bacterium]
MIGCAPEIYKAVSRLSYGLYIVSSFDGEKLNGQLVNTVFQLTASPPRLAASLNKANLTRAYVEKSGLYSVSVLAQDAPMPFLGLFGFRTGRDINKFEKTAFKTLAGCPAVTENALAIVTIRAAQAVDMGTHTLFIGEVIAAETLKDGVPLTYDHYKSVKHGKTQKNAATFMPEE